MELKYMLEVINKNYPFNAEDANKHLKDNDCKVVVTNYFNGNSEYIKSMKNEHSLPMQLVFLQNCLKKDVLYLPLYVGHLDDKDIP